MPGYLYHIGPVPDSLVLLPELLLSFDAGEQYCTKSGVLYSFFLRHQMPRLESSHNMLHFIMQQPTKKCRENLLLYRAIHIQPWHGNRKKKNKKRSGKNLTRHCRKKLWLCFAKKQRKRREKVVNEYDKFQTRLVYWPCVDTRHKFLLLIQCGPQSI